jgi:hypothetical protein
LDNLDEAIPGDPHLEIIPPQSSGAGRRRVPGPSVTRLHCLIVTGSPGTNECSVLSHRLIVVGSISVKGTIDKIRGICKGKLDLLVNK